LGVARLRGLAAPARGREQRAALKPLAQLNPGMWHTVVAVRACGCWRRSPAMWQPWPLLQTCTTP
jgi:hypothetical protein